VTSGLTHPSRKLARMSVLCLGLCLQPVSLFAIADEGTALSLTNVASSSRDGTWDWKAYISGDATDISKVHCVVYTLHPTFPNPIQRVCETSDPLYPLAIHATGWGTFNLRAKLEFKDGTSKELTHYLDFSAGNLTIEDNIDRTAKDHSGVYRDSNATPDLLSCQQLCLNDKQCKAYVFIPIGSKPNNWRGPAPPHCWLRDKTIPPSPYKGLISGVRRD
jgi:hypothetical protein